MVIDHFYCYLTPRKTYTLKTIKLRVVKRLRSSISLCKVSFSFYLVCWTLDSLSFIHFYSCVYPFPRDCNLYKEDNWVLYYNVKGIKGESAAVNCSILVWYFCFSFAFEKFFFLIWFYFDFITRNCQRLWCIYFSRR